ncbi:reverse transcriptase domain-containing protein [Tanacetum coccineum]
METYSPPSTASIEENKIEIRKLGTTKEREKLENLWKMYTDEASSFDGSGISLMLVIPEGKEYTYALRFEFKNTNNEAEYEALLAGLRVAEEMKIKNLAIYIDAQLVFNQVKGLFKARKPVKAIFREDERNLEEL